MINSNIVYNSILDVHDINIIKLKNLYTFYFFDRRQLLCTFTIQGVCDTIKTKELITSLTGIEIRHIN